MITPSPCFMSALRGTSSGLAQNKKRYANNASYGDGHTKDALVVTLVTTRRRCALRERKGSDISAKIVWFYRVSYKNGSLLLFLGLGDERKTPVVSAAFTDTIVAFNQHPVNSRPAIPSARCIALVENVTQFGLVLREERAIEKVFRDRQRTEVIGREIETR